ncbi:MAG TPA: hypothetical protein PLU30_16175 [Verrucomicrobiae bacterium]|nr:hypothetical protein [Verrucomicrobiae bacterium]
MTDITLHFQGPFTFIPGERSLFHCSAAKSAGIYLWTHRQNADGSHLIHYIGETGSFAQRHRQHLIEILGMNYGIFDPDHAKIGKSTLLWPGLWRDPSADGPGELLGQYEAMTPTVIRYVHALTVFFAPLETETKFRKHVEGLIAWNLRTRHLEASALYPDDNYTSKNKAITGVRLLISSAEPIQGLDREIAA